MYTLSHFFLVSLLTLLSPPVLAQSLVTGPSLDLNVKYYNRILNPEGVLRESHYEEKIVRRPGHVWTYRILPKHMDVVPTNDEHLHAHFNYVVVPRHITFNEQQTTVAFVDEQEHYVVNIEPPEYGNIGFDGSWKNAYYLVDPKFIAQLPITQRPSPVKDAQWHETEKDGVFQRILWDNNRMIPLIAEIGDVKHSFYNRVEVKADPKLSLDLPWTKQHGYVQKIYADFLD